MKKFSILFLAFFLFSLSSFAQKITVQEGSELINSVNRTGLYTIVNLDDKTVEKAWAKRLKDFGKPSSSKGAYTIPAAEVPGVTAKPGVVYSKVIKDKKGGVKIWWAIDLGSSFVSSDNNASQYRGASQILTDFAAACYRDDINEQIEEAEKALSKTVKDYEKEVKEGESLVRDVEHNKQEKASLEQRLADNATELTTLQNNIQQNKTDQQKAQQDVEKMKQAVEVVKSKLNGIGK